MVGTGSTRIFFFTFFIFAFGYFYNLVVYRAFSFFVC